MVVDAKGAAVRMVGNGEARGLAVEENGRVVLVQKAGCSRKGEPGTPRLARHADRAEGGRPDQGDRRHVGDRRCSRPASGSSRTADQRAVFRFDRDGKFVGPFAAFRANRLAVGPGDQVALLDRDNNTISIYDRAGKPAAPIQARAAGKALEKPVDLAYDSMGHLYVLDRAAVAVFAPDGKFVTSFAAPEKTAGAFRDAAALGARRRRTALSLRRGSRADPGVPVARARRAHGTGAAAAGFGGPATRG